MGLKLGDVSPLAGMVTGEGLTADLMAKGIGGIIPAAITRDARKSREEEEKQKQAGGPPQGYAKGGKVKGCGCAKRGVKKCKLR
jgi:hypothetical protein